MFPCEGAGAAQGAELPFVMATEVLGMMSRKLLSALGPITTAQFAKSTHSFVVQSSQGTQLNMLLARNLGRPRERRVEGYFHGCSCVVLTCSRCAGGVGNWDQPFS